MKSVESYPFVSIICVTYNRRSFIPVFLENVNNQLYPKSRYELIIVDDGSDSIQDLFEKKDNDKFQIKYHRLLKKMNLGEKRNYSHTLIDKRTKYISYFDDDDYHCQDRLCHSIEMLVKNPSFLCAGSTILFVFFPKINQMFQFGPYFVDNHATAGTFTFHVDLLKITRFNNKSCFGEEKTFLKNYQIPLLQLNPLKTILVVAHTHNTVDKKQFVGSIFSKESYVSVNFFLKLKPENKKVRDFFLLLD